MSLQEEAVLPTSLLIMSWYDEHDEWWCLLYIILFIQLGHRLQRTRWPRFFDISYVWAPADKTGR